VGIEIEQEKEGEEILDSNELRREGKRRVFFFFFFTASFGVEH